MRLLPRLRGKSGATLPQNYRDITARNLYLDLILALEVVFLILLLLFLGYLLFIYKKTQTIRTYEFQQLNKWEKLILKHPNYPEVYYNAALHEARVGDTEKALLYLRRSLRLNPNFAPSVLLQKELSK